VLVDGSTAPEDIDTKVNELLEPYDENIQVDGYEEGCYCVGHKATLEVYAQVNEEFGSMETVRKDFWATNNSPSYPGENAGEEEWDAYSKANNENDHLWKELITPRLEAQEKYKAEHPGITVPNEACEACKGSGTVISTYNPKSKWDWWSYGGRYNGYIEGEQKDDGDKGFNFGDKFRQLDNNIVKVKDISPYVKAFAVVTPDGEWHERGQMGWWAMVTDEDEDWPEKFSKLLQDNKDCWAIGLDLHI